MGFIGYLDTQYKLEEKDKTSKTVSVSLLFLYKLKYIKVRKQQFDFVRASVIQLSANLTLNYSLIEP